jgi:hypothetical protein
MCHLHREAERRFCFVTAPERTEQCLETLKRGGLLQLENIVICWSLKLCEKCISDIATTSSHEYFLSLHQSSYTTYHWVWSDYNREQSIYRIQRSHPSLISGHSPLTQGLPLVWWLEVPRKQHSLFFCEFMCSHSCILMGAPPGPTRLSWGPCHHCFISHSSFKWALPLAPNSFYTTCVLNCPLLPTPYSFRAETPFRILVYQSGQSSQQPPGSTY